MQFSGPHCTLPHSKLGRKVGATFVFAHGLRQAMGSSRLARTVALRALGLHLLRHGLNADPGCLCDIRAQSDREARGICLVDLIELVGELLGAFLRRLRLHGVLSLRRDLVRNLC